MIKVFYYIQKIYTRIKDRCCVCLHDQLLIGNDNKMGNNEVFFT